MFWNLQKVTEVCNNVLKFANMVWSLKTLKIAKNKSKFGKMIKVYEKCFEACKDWMKFAKNFEVCKIDWNLKKKIIEVFKNVLKFAKIDWSLQKLIEVCKNHF